MTRRHFDAIAGALKARKPYSDAHLPADIDALRQWRGDCEAMADVLVPYIAEADESVPEGYKYSREAFLTACGVE